MESCRTVFQICEKSLTFPKPNNLFITNIMFNCIIHFFAGTCEPAARLLEQLAARCSAKLNVDVSSEGFLSP